MAVRTINIGNMENWAQYDDTETYSDASLVQGIKAATIQVTTAPADDDDVVRLAEVGGGGGIAPDNALYLIIGPNTADLVNERVITAGVGIQLVDGGANSTLTISTTGAAQNEYWQSPVVDKDLTAPPI